MSSSLLPNSEMWGGGVHEISELFVVSLSLIPLRGLSVTATLLPLDEELLWLLLLRLAMVDGTLPIERVEMLPVFFRPAVVEEEAILGRGGSAVSAVVRLILLCVLV